MKNETSQLGNMDPIDNIGQKNLTGRAPNHGPAMDYDYFKLELSWAWDPVDRSIPKGYYYPKETQFYISL